LKKTNLFKRIDKKSLKFKLLLTFIIFSCFIFILLWLLQTVFFAYFYETNKKDEIILTASLVMTKLYDDNIQEVIEPANIKGTKIIKKDGNLKIENTNLNLSTIFENYKGLEENCLDLNNFIENYKNYENSNYEENNEEIIMKTKNNIKNKYTENKILYINKASKKPTKLIIEDANQNMTINIQYNEIELN